MTIDRKARWNEVVESYQPCLDDHPDEVKSRFEDGDRFALVEKSRFDRDGDTYFLASFTTPEGAADYHDGQEWPEDWIIQRLIDLDTGDGFYPDVRTTFKPSPDSKHGFEFEGEDN